jgi:hypothetical protein
MAGLKFGMGEPEQKEWLNCSSRLSDLIPRSKHYPGLQRPSGVLAIQKEGVSKVEGTEPCLHQRLGNGRPFEVD